LLKLIETYTQTFTVSVARQVDFRRFGIFEVAPLKISTLGVALRRLQTGLTQKSQPKKAPRHCANIAAKVHVIGIVVVIVTVASTSKRAEGEQCGTELKKTL
jgi:hypothetical protein